MDDSGIKEKKRHKHYKKKKKIGIVNKEGPEINIRMDYKVIRK